MVGNNFDSMIGCFYCIEVRCVCVLLCFLLLVVLYCCFISVYVIGGMVGVVYCMFVFFDY
jgi:hypothetical protein